MATFPPLKLLFVLFFFFHGILGRSGEKRNVKKNTRNLRIGALPWSLENNTSIWMMLELFDARCHRDRSLRGRRYKGKGNLGA